MAYLGKGPLLKWIVSHIFKIIGLSSEEQYLNKKSKWNEET
jgi:hypothetical protein